MVSECLSYHDSESFRSDVEREDFKCICDKHRCVGNVIKEIENENEWNCRYLEVRPGEAQYRNM